MSHASKDPSTDPDATVDALPKGSRRNGMLKLIKGEPQGAAQEVVDLLVLGSALDLGDGTAFTVNGPEVAFQHARISRAAGGAFVLEDLGTPGGTYVNEIRVGRRTLMLGDKIRLGSSVVLEFTF